MYKRQNQDGSNWGVYAQRFDADGTARGDEFRVNTHTGSQQEHPDVTALSNGGFVVVWSDYENNNGGMWFDVSMQFFGADGAPVGGEHSVINDYNWTDQERPAVTELSNGDVIVTWWDEAQNDVYAQRFDSSGAVVGENFRVNSDTGSSQS